MVALLRQARVLVAVRVPCNVVVGRPLARSDIEMMSHVAHAEWSDRFNVGAFAKSVAIRHARHPYPSLPVYLEAHDEVYPTQHPDHAGNEWRVVRLTAYLMQPAM